MIYAFGDCLLDEDRHELRRAGQVVAIEPKVFQVLLYLLQHRDRVVTKDDLFAHCWPEMFVSEAALTRCLAKIRQAVQAGHVGEPVIKTIHRQGYRFVAAVTTQPAAPAATLQQEMLPSPVPPAVPSAPPSPPPIEPAPPHSSPDVPTPAPLRLLGAERRQVTVLGCTLVDAARLVRERDPEDLHAVMHAYHNACAAIIERFAGHLAQYRNDGVLAYFGYPQAHDDDAQRAIHAGLQMVETLGQQPEVARVLDEALRVRVGIHTGLVVVGQRAGDRSPPLAVGDTPTVTAALQTLAPPGTVVISATTARLVAGYFVCEPLEVPELPDVAVALPVSRVVRPSGAQTRLDVATPRGLTSFVGREEELGLLLARWEQATDGMGQMVLLSGEAGIGKSRLVEVLSERVLRRGATRMVFRCSPYAQNSALYPVVEHLQRLLHWHRDDAPEVKLHKLEQALRSSRLPLDEVVPLLATLLSIPLPERYSPLPLSPQRQKQRTLEALGAWLLEATERQPILAVWEDVHWADPSALEWLSLLLDQTPTARLLTLLLFRPEFRPPWNLRSHLTQLTLSRLRRPQVEAMILRVTDGKELPDEVVQQIAAKTDGVPLFVEELTKVVLESSWLRAGVERYELVRPLPALAIPTTLHDSLMARLDRLGAAKEVAQLGATLGRTFTYGLLQAVADREEAALQRELTTLVEGELLYQRGVPPQATYTFKHALIQDAAYQSLLRSTRQQYHLRIAHVMEAQFPEVVATQPELLAHHFSHGEVWDKAVPYCQQAGARAHDRAAFREAVAAFEQALQALAHLPEDGATRGLALELRLALDNPLTSLAEHERRLVLLGEAEALARALDDRARLGGGLARMNMVLRQMGDLDGAIAAGQQALELAAALGDSALQGEAFLRLGRTYWSLGDFRRAVEMLRRNVEAADQASGTHRTDMQILSQASLAWNLSDLGAFAEGRRHGEEALRLATLAGRGDIRLIAHGHLGHLYLAQGDLDSAIRVLEPGLALCRASDAQTHLRQIAAALGYATALQERLVEGRALLEEAISACIRTGGVAALAYRFVWLSEVCRLAGRDEEAWQHAHQALDLARQQKEPAHEALALHQIGVVQTHAEPPDAEQAEAHYRQALALAEELGMRPLQAHCHLGLGTLYAKIGQPEQARPELSAAMALYRAMEMTFWLPQAEAALAQVT